MRSKQTNQAAGATTPDPMLELLREVLERTGSARVRVHGTSMRPFINDGDVVLVRRRPAEELRPGDIAACIREEGLVMHRLLRIDRAGRLRLKGDTLRGPDAPIVAGGFIGCVEMVETARGRMDLTTPEARRANLFVMRYMYPVSIIYSLWGSVADTRAPARKGSIPRRIRALLEKAPRQAARRLIIKNR